MERMFEMQISHIKTEGVYLEYIHIVLGNDMKVKQIVFICYTAALVSGDERTIEDCHLLQCFAL